MSVWTMVTVNNGNCEQCIGYTNKTRETWCYEFHIVMNLTASILCFISVRSGFLCIGHPKGLILIMRFWCFTTQIISSLTCNICWGLSYYIIMHMFIMFIMTVLHWHLSEIIKGGPRLWGMVNVISFASLLSTGPRVKWDFIKKIIRKVTTQG